MTPIPAEALPVVEILRRDVPRPATLPVSRHGDGLMLRWYLVDCYCPMGLHPAATSPRPASPGAFPLASEKAIFAFFHWWDRWTDAAAALDAVWGPA